MLLELRGYVDSAFIANTIRVFQLNFHIHGIVECVQVEARFYVTNLGCGWIILGQTVVHIYRNIQTIIGVLDGNSQVVDLCPFVLYAWDMCLQTYLLVAFIDESFECRIRGE